MHLTDILENAARAGATRVAVDLAREGAEFVLQVRDNGPGLPPGVRERPTDPFATTRTERPVGLGLALLRMAAERTGGSLAVESPPGGGVTVRAAFHLDHLDAQPVGPLESALSSALASWPGLDLDVLVNGRRVLDTAALRAELKDIDCSQPRIHNFLSALLRQELAEVERPA